jgi:hypothetical protein
VAQHLAAHVRSNLSDKDFAMAVQLVPMLKAAAGFATKAAKNPKVQEAAREAGTAVAGKIAEHTLKRMSDGHPEARAQKAPAQNEQMAPRSSIIPMMMKQSPSGQPSFAAKQTYEPPAFEGFGLRRSNAIRHPTTPHDKRNPDALPHINDKGKWIDSRDPKNLGQLGFASRASPGSTGPDKTAAQPQRKSRSDNAAPQQKPRPAQQQAAAESKASATRLASADSGTRVYSSQPSILETLQGLGGLFKNFIAALQPKVTTKDKVVALSVKGGNGESIEIQVSRSAVKAYQKDKGIPDAEFDLGKYLKYEQERYNELPATNVKVRGDGINDLTALGDVGELEINSFHAREKILGV